MIPVLPPGMLIQGRPCIMSSSVFVFISRLLFILTLSSEGELAEAVDERGVDEAMGSSSSESEEEKSDEEKKKEADKAAEDGNTSLEKGKKKKKKKAKDKNSEYSSFTQLISSL